MVACFWLLIYGVGSAVMIYEIGGWLYSDIYKRNSKGEETKMIT